MNEMIERMADAATGCELSTWHPNVQEQLKKQMRDILKSIREPSNYYCVAIVNALGCYPDKLSCDAVRRVHMAMIDEVLK